MRTRKPDYTPLPQVPAELVPRIQLVLEVWSGTKTVSQAARELGLSRNRFQSLMHRALAAFVQEIAPQPAGRPAKSAAETELQRQLAQLQRVNRRLAQQADSSERLLTAASELLQTRIRSAPRQRRSRKPAAGAADGSEESEARRRQLLAGVLAMRALKQSATRCAALAGVGTSTLRRWQARASHGRPLAPGRQVAASVTAEVATAAATRVRELHGLIGAASLSHAIAGLSRRRAAIIKATTLGAIERERKAALIRIRVTTAGVLRGLDAMHLGGSYALIAADAAVPYRTSVTLGSRYDVALVARALERDLEHHGAPLVYRLDRARTHDAPQARAVLAAHQVIMLHGPPHHPGYYGQLERQNREHRAWLRASRAPTASCLADMLDSVNRLWPRPSLAWHTAAQAWSSRPPLNVDRQAFHEEVNARTARIARTLDLRGHTADLAERLAIEQTLARMGYLRQEIGGWC